MPSIPQMRRVYLPKELHDRMAEVCPPDIVVDDMAAIILDSVLKNEICFEDVLEARNRQSEDEIEALIQVGAIDDCPAA